MSSLLFSYAIFKVLNFITGGDKEIRTLDPLLARQVLSQLSYTPISEQPQCLPLYNFTDINTVQTLV